MKIMVMIMVELENGAKEFMEGARDFEGLFGHGRRKRRRGRKSAVGDVRHGEISGGIGDSRVELALEGVELEGVIECAATVPRGGLRRL